MLTFDSESIDRMTAVPADVEARAGHVVCGYLDRHPGIDAETAGRVMFYAGYVRGKEDFRVAASELAAALGQFRMAAERVAELIEMGQL